ncbi:hypothetical protein IWW50_006120 [Coemansia erecta]|nr:hypothetical protein IWW50_006120 [Coemansia erecta]
MSSHTPQSYEEKAKQQMRDYQKWRKHFVWSPDLIRTTLCDYALWSLLGFVAYYNMTSRTEREEYEAKSFMVIDQLEEKIHMLDPNNRLLEGTTRAPQPELAAEHNAAAHSSSQPADVENPSMFF